MNFSDEEMSDGVDEIPAKKPITPKANVVEEAEDEEDDEDAEDEYKVEKIVGHAFNDDGTPLYHIKWLGYEKKSDMTWEPLENLENAMDLVDEYHARIGGPPKFEAKSTKSKKGKRTASTAFEDSPSIEPSAGKKRGRKSDAATNGESVKQFPAGTWEDSVQRIHTVLEEPEANDTPAKTKGRAGSMPGDRMLVGLIEWNDGTKTQHPLHVLRRKCPQKMLDYYEAHLVFRSASAKDDEDAAAAARVDEP